MARFGRIFILVMFMTLLAGAATVYADQGTSLPGPDSAGQPSQPPGPPPGNGLTGEVTEKTADSLTLRTSAGNTVVVNVDQDTGIRLSLGRSEGVWSDVEVGAQVRVDGRSDRDGVMTAWDIWVVSDGKAEADEAAPAHGALASSKDRSGDTTTIVIGDDTKVTVDGKPGSASDVKSHKFVLAFGETQSDGSVAASWAVVSDRREGVVSPPPPGGNRSGPQAPSGRQDMDRDDGSQAPSGRQDMGEDDGSQAPSGRQDLGSEKRPRPPFDQPRMDRGPRPPFGPEGMDRGPRPPFGPPRMGDDWAPQPPFGPQGMGDNRGPRPPFGPQGMGDDRAPQPPFGPQGMGDDRGPRPPFGSQSTRDDGGATRGNSAPDRGSSGHGDRSPEPGR